MVAVPACGRDWEGRGSRVLYAELDAEAMRVPENRRICWMKKIVLVPDSFKGTLSATRVCEIMEDVIRTQSPQTEVVSIPVADGGEGSVDCFLRAVGGTRVDVVVKGPYFEDMTAAYGLLPDGTAVIEMAACSGLPLVGENRHAEKTTTYGVGQLMVHAAAGGCKRILVGLGGSATNDGGTGAAAAAGVRFLDHLGHPFVPVGDTLKHIDVIDVSGLDPRLEKLDIITMCDIDNPLCGESGAAHVFGPQKGADPFMVQQLDAGLAHLAERVQKHLGKAVALVPGAGAAGGMGAGMMAFFSSELRMGIEAVLDTVHFDDIVRDADLVFSGEGKIDEQSLRGKVVIGVARRTKKAGVPLIAVVGDVGDGVGAAYDMGVTAIFSINRRAVPFNEARHRSEANLADTMSDIIRTLRISERSLQPCDMDGFR